MTWNEAIEMLKAHRRWLNGKGRKYIPTDLPISASQISEAIDFCVSYLKTRVGPESFREIVRLAEGQYMFDRKEKIKDELSDRAIRDARKVIRYLNKIGV